MNTSALFQPPNNTSLMGVAQGALSHFGDSSDPATAYFASAHGFAINIHTTLCPSGPYCWNFKPSLELLRNIGLEVEQLCMCASLQSEWGSEAIEAEVKKALKAGDLCSVLWLDHQLVLDVTDTRFVLAQPWKSQLDSTPAHMTFGTWEEFKNGPPVAFLRWHKGGVQELSYVREEAVKLAIDLWRNPSEYEFGPQPYAVGSRAYDIWHDALDTGTIEEHGNYWNAAVWSECRQSVAQYLHAWSLEGDQHATILGILSHNYSEIAALLRRVGNKDLKSSEQVGSVQQAKSLELTNVNLLELML